MAQKALFKQSVNELLIQPGSDDFVAALKSGIVDVYQFQNEHNLTNLFDEVQRNAIADAMVQEYVSSTLDAILDHTTYPLLDRPSSRR